MYDFIDQALILSFYNHTEGVPSEYVNIYIKDILPGIIQKICQVKFIDPSYVDISYCESLIRDFAQLLDHVNESDFKKITQDYLMSLKKIILTKGENGSMINAETGIQFEKRNNRWYAVSHGDKELTNHDKIICKMNGWSHI